MSKYLYLIIGISVGVTIGWWFFGREVYYMPFKTTCQDRAFKSVSYEYYPNGRTKSLSCND